MCWISTFSSLCLLFLSFSLWSNLALVKIFIWSYLRATLKRVMFLNCRRKPEYVEKKPHMHGENMQTIYWIYCTGLWEGKISPVSSETGRDINHSQHDTCGNPCAPQNCICSLLRQVKHGPLSILCTPFSWKWPLSAQTLTDTHSVYWEQVKIAFHKGQGWPVRTLTYICTTDYKWESRRGSAKSFFLSFSRQYAQSY